LDIEGGNTTEYYIMRSCCANMTLMFTRGRPVGIMGKDVHGYLSLVGKLARKRAL
jgi:hypothetical protein